MDRAEDLMEELMKEHNEKDSMLIDRLVVE
jgi:hypothetical protein